MPKIVILFIMLLNHSVFSQQSELSKSVNYLSEFISSDYFKRLKEQVDDLSLLDSIYIRALHFNENDVSEALLSLTFGTIPYREIPIQIPIANFIIYFPLISHNDSVFSIKNENLPGDLLFDSPGNDFGDKDKPAHFFGSAFISYNSVFFDLGGVFGYFVEVFEENFKVQSSVDERDLKVNELGRTFGKILRQNPGILPSVVLIFHSVFYFRYSL